MGEPSLPHRTTPRYGTRGSLKLDLEKGTWYDFERKEGGGVLDLIEWQTGLEGRDRIDWLKQHSFVEGSHPGNGAAQPTRPKPAPARRIVAEYDYTDEDGILLSQVVRYEPKDFRQRRPDGNGGWIWKCDDVRLVPYRLPALLEAVASDHTVFVVEGEKDADNLTALGLTATTNAGGDKAWPESFAQYFRGASVIVIPDNDDAGREHVAAVAANLAPVARLIRILELPGLPPKKDVSDWLEAGGTVDGLYDLGAETKPWVQPPSPPRPSCPWPDPLDEAAFHGLAGEVVRTSRPIPRPTRQPSCCGFLDCLRQRRRPRPLYPGRGRPARAAALHGRLVGERRRPGRAAAGDGSAA